MSYVPGSLTVPYGDRLVIDLVNLDDGSPHDLTFDNGTQTGRVMPRRSATLDVGVMGASTQGWCRIIGHRQMGMVLDVLVTGGRGDEHREWSGDRIRRGDGLRRPGSARPHGHTRCRLRGRARGPPPDRGGTHPRRDADDRGGRAARWRPGCAQRRWTFDGTVPGPTLHGRVGDTFVVTLVNHGSMGHSIDFHAGERAPDDVMRTIAPGSSLTYRFTADRAGVWMYHCSTMPMSAHIAAGMHGAVVIEPDGLPAVDRSYVLVQSEVHLDGDGRSSVREVDAASAGADTPDAVVFNGIANQYAARPVAARVGERVRFWVLAAGPNRGSSFHVVGGQFDTVWAEGAYRLRDGVGPLGGRDGGSQVLALAVAQGGFVELTPREPGRYPFVTHAMADAERGARGVLQVTP